MAPAKRSGQHQDPQRGIESSTVRNSAYARLLDGLFHNGSDADLLACVRSAADAREATGMLVLICAWGSRQYPGLVRELVRLGADVEYRTYKQALTPLSIATIHGHAAIARVLMDVGARVDVRDERGRSPIDLALSSGHETILRLYRLRFPALFKPSQIPIKKSFFTMTKDEKEALLKEAAEEAIAEAHAAGRPTTHGDEKGVYRLYPDGHKEYIKRYARNREGVSRRVPRHFTTPS